MGYVCNRITHYLVYGFDYYINSEKKYKDFCYRYAIDIFCNLYLNILKKNIFTV